MSALPGDYAERVYAGVLGKIVGVYLGRPVEGWTYRQIQDELGDITGYVHQRLGVPLVVTDDDISGTFTFLRALPDHGNRLGLTPAEIGRTWLNYLIEGRTVLWWGGLGMSTEHTAFLRLKHGIEAPRSGSRALNGTVVSEQIGAQIFIDGWAMVAPGRPALAADLARRAASVSHDGEAVHAAALLAAMESAAFVADDIDRLLDCGLSMIPAGSAVARMIGTIRDWHAGEPDWRAARAMLDAEYGYHRYGGNCHVMPNHGLIVLALLYGQGDFHRSMRIVNTAGWDTDCNSGNLECLLGIRGGLAGLTAAVPKDGARFTFAMPGSVQGFEVRHGRCSLANSSGRALEMRLAEGPSAVVTTATFIPPEYAGPQHDGFIASPTLYPGQRIRADVLAPGENAAPVECRLVVQHYGAGDELATLSAGGTTVGAGQARRLTWVVPDTGGQPIAAVGLAIRHDGAATVLLDSLGWDGAPNVVLRPLADGTMWKRQWVDALDHVHPGGPQPFRLIQNEGVGLRLIGTREWTDYRVEARLTPGLSASFGLVVRAQGLRRYYALVVSRDGVARLVRRLHDSVTLAETPVHWPSEQTHTLAVAVAGTRIEAWLDGAPLLAAVDDRLSSGAAGLPCEEGLVEVDTFAVAGPPGAALPQAVA